MFYFPFSSLPIRILILFPSSAHHQASRLNSATAFVSSLCAAMTSLNSRSTSLPIFEFCLLELLFDLFSLRFASASIFLCLYASAETLFFSRSYSAAICFPTTAFFTYSISKPIPLFTVFRFRLGILSIVEVRRAFSSMVGRSLRRPCRRPQSGRVALRERVDDRTEGLL